MTPYDHNGELLSVSNNAVTVPGVADGRNLFMSPDSRWAGAQVVLASQSRSGWGYVMWSG